MLTQNATKTSSRIFVGDGMFLEMSVFRKSQLCVNVQLCEYPSPGDFPMRNLMDFMRL